MKLNDFRLSTRITAGMLLLMSVAAVVWIVTESARLQSAYLKERSADMESVLHAEKVRLVQSIETLRQNTLFLANIPSVFGMVRAEANHGIDPRDKNSYAIWEQRLQETFSAFLVAHPDYFKVRFIGVANDGRELVRVDRREGRIEITSHETLQAKGGRDFFKVGSALTVGRVYLSEFNLNQDWGKIEEIHRPTLRAVTPVFDANGQVFGVIVINQDVRPLFDSTSAGLPQDVQTLITDQQGHYLLHPDSQRAFSFELGGNDTITDDFPALKTMFESQAQNYLPLHAESGRHGLVYLAAERVFFDAANPQRFMLLAHYLPEKVVAAQAAGIVLPNIFKTLVVAMVMGLIFMLVLRHMFAPLRRITVAAREITAGKRKIRLSLDSGGEIGELESSLNTMLDKLVDHDFIDRENTFRKELIESLPGVFYMIDQYGRYLMWNQNLERVLQRTAEEMASGHPLDFFRDEDKINIENALREVFTQGEASLEAVLIAKDGTGTPYHFTGRRVERDGEPVLIGMGLDLTRQNENMRVTKALLNRNQALMHNSMEGIRILDVEGNVLEVNDAFCNTLGYTREEALRLNVADWDMQWSREELRKRFTSMIGHGAQFETVHRRKDGSLVEVEITTCSIEFEGQIFIYAASRDITERKKIQSVQQRYKHVIETAMDGFWVTSLEGMLEEVNEAYARMSGYTMQELVGMHISQLEIHESAEQVEAHLAKIIAQGYDRFETQHRRKDGNVIDIEVAVTVLSETNRLCVFCRDITEQRASMRSAEMFLRRNQILMQNSMEGIHVLDVNGNIVEANDAFCNMLGYTRAEAMQLNLLDWDDQFSAEEVSARIKEYMGRSGTFEAVHRRKDGSLMDVDVCINAVEIEGSVYLFAASRDITARKQAEAELRVAAATFETQDATLITDAQSNIIRVNRAFTKITGYSPEEVIGKNPSLMSSGRHDKEFYALMWQNLLKHGSWAGEIWDKRKDGEVYPKWMTITAVKNEHGETTQYVAIFSDITSRKQAEEEIRNLAFYDALTQLPNRRFFLERFNSALLASTRYDDHGAILFIDLDRFKLLNDMLGHDFGDLLLVEVAARIKSCVREVDTVARLGGDEFVVLLESIGDIQEEASRNAVLVAEKIRELLAQPYLLKEHEHYSSPSIGISLYHSDDETIDVLLKHADAAMYQAKAAGRNTVHFYDPTLQQDLEARTALENDLRRAIENRELHLHYQIQVDAEHSPIGVEALLRWIHPLRGVVSPAKFIPIAEDSSLILGIGNWVLETACMQLAAWSKDKRMCDLTLAINVSAHQFRLHDFVNQITLALQKHHVKRGRLKVELTESVVLNDMNDVILKMQALHDLGVKLSLDDFGTGYSSLSYLKRLPLDQIKIDQSFIRDITLDPGDAVMVRTIIDMAKNFKLEVIAEGVETEAQLLFLKHHDCRAYQGYFFGRPVPLEELSATIDKLPVEIPTRH